MPREDSSREEGKLSDLVSGAAAADDRIRGSCSGRAPTGFPGQAVYRFFQRTPSLVSSIRYPRS